MKFVLSPSEYTFVQHKGLVGSCIEDLLITPRFAFKKWAAVTHQTPAAKAGYSYQHLASVVTNIRGRGSAARGDDLTDGTEVKACSRVNQLDTCKKCKGGVMRCHTECENCGGTCIRRNNDSKWLITLRNQADLDAFCNLKRAIFLIEDYPAFDQGNYRDMRIRAYEIYPRFNPVFQSILRDYYHNTFVPNSKKRVTPAPKNFWPDSYGFHICSPVKVLDALVTNFDTSDYRIEIRHLAVPHEMQGDAAGEVGYVEPMPVSLLTEPERDAVRSAWQFPNGQLPVSLDSAQRSCLPLR